MPSTVYLHHVCLPEYTVRDGVGSVCVGEMVERFACMPSVRSGGQLTWSIMRSN